jgi:hypothetical protein
MKYKIKYGRDIPQDDMKKMVMKDKKSAKPRDKITEEYIKNAPTIRGFTIAQLAEKSNERRVCPKCGRPYNDNIKF